VCRTFCFKITFQRSTKKKSKKKPNPKFEVQNLRGVDPLKMASIETLYDKNCTIRLQTYSGTASDEESSGHDRLRQVRIVLRLQTRNTPPHRRDLVMRLTDDSDYFFLYTLTIGDEDYQGLRREQGLLVDFNTFPSSFIGLLKSCEQAVDSRSNSQYVLNLIQSESASTSTSYLKVLETNAFRQITHLSLKFIPGNDTDIKEYMSECLATYKDLYENTRGELANTRSVFSSKLEAAENEVGRLETKNAELQRELLTKTDHLVARHQTQLSQLRDEKSQKEAELSQLNRVQREELENRLQDQVSQLQIDISQKDSVNKELTERKFRAESQLREHSLKIKTYEEELDRANDELKKLRTINHDLTVYRYESEKQISAYKTQVALLDQEVKNKLEIIDKTVQQNGALEEQKRIHEERLEDFRLENKKQREKLKGREAEISKANEIIKKFVKKNEELQDKNYMKNVVSIQQEEVVKEKTVKNGELQEALDKLSVECKEKTGKLENGERVIEELRTQLKNNENCIQWLNKQLNDKQRGVATAPLGTSAYSRAQASTLNSMVQMTPAQQHAPIPMTAGTSSINASHLPKHASTPLARAPLRGGAAAAAAMSFINDSVDQAKENQSPRTPQLATRNGTNSPTGLTPVGGGKAPSGKDFGLDPKYFSPSALSLESNTAAKKPPSGLAASYMGGMVQRKIPQ